MVEYKGREVPYNHTCESIYESLGISKEYVESQIDKTFSDYVTVGSISKRIENALNNLGLLHTTYNKTQMFLVMDATLFVEKYQKEHD